MLDHQELQNELRALTERVESLEARLTAGASAATTTATAPTHDHDGFWALNGLQNRLSDHASTIDGAVVITGSLTLPDGSPVAWQQTDGSAGLIESSWEPQASAFAALGHPVRIELLRHMLNGVRATSDLAAIEALGTTGQLHHHLRQLVAAGWVRQAGRGEYEIPAARIVPLLACVSGAQR
ncbi:ArsR/SmtB family transcription factor [Humidisolicoccus flavus]|uniref:ArsR/SmtB family transcription factor n=1 Tax=Humidisolicoccus flavus TaxID=3111414 RepID=UPI0032559E0F